MTFINLFKIWLSFSPFQIFPDPISNVYEKDVLKNVSYVFGLDCSCEWL